METKLSKQQLMAMKPLEVLDHEFVKHRFIDMYCKFHGIELPAELAEEKYTSSTVAAHFENLKYQMVRIISSNAKLISCTGLSVYGCILDFAANGLTLDTGPQPLAYLLPGSVKVGANPDRYETRMTIEISPYGELALRINAGQILHADNPVIVYQNDLFKPKYMNGYKMVDYECEVPRTSKQIKASFIRLTRPDNSFDFFWMLPDDIDRLKKYSERKNRGKSNALYGNDNTSIDTGFLAAKTIKHAFKTFPKIRIGQFSKYQEDDVQAFEYGLEEGIAPNETAQASMAPPSFDEEPGQPVPSFATPEPNGHNKGIVFNNLNSDEPF